MHIFWVIFVSNVRFTINCPSIPLHVHRFPDTRCFPTPCSQKSVFSAIRHCHFTDTSVQRLSLQPPRLTSSAVNTTITRRRIPIQLIFEEYSTEQGQIYRQAMAKLKQCKPWREINCRREWGQKENTEHL